MTAKIIDIKDARKRPNNAKQAKMMDEIIAMNLSAWAVFWRTLFGTVPPRLTYTSNVIVLKKD